MDLKTLKATLKIMRENGVLHLKTADVELSLSPEAINLSNKNRGVSNTEDQNEIPTDNPYANFPDGILTDEQLMYYSAGGTPEEDPYRNDQ